MNKESVPTTIKLGFAPRPTFDLGTQVPANRLVEITQDLITSVDRFSDSMLRGIQDYASMTGSDWWQMYDAMLRVVSSKATPAVVLHPSVWRSLKAVRVKHKAKRRTHARMRSRGYVAHGRHNA